MVQAQETRNPLFTKESRTPTIVAFSLTLLLLVVTVGDFMDDLEVTAAFTSKSPEWRIDFDTQNESMQVVETLQDDETRNVEFDLSEINVPEGYLIGHIEAIVTSEEVEGFSGQCDSVAADIIENDLTAQWDSEENNLSGQDSSCMPIVLELVVYPDYNGESMVVSAINEYQALLNWTLDGWGDGVLSIDLDLDVNAPLGFDPIGSDTDEEITVDVTVTMFSVSIEKTN